MPIAYKHYLFNQSCLRLFLEIYEPAEFCLYNSYNIQLYYFNASEDLY